MKPLILFIFLVFLTGCGCSIKNSVNNEYFHVTDSFYQPWVLSEDEKGTTVTVKIEKSVNDILFDSLIFRGVKLPIVSSAENNQLILKSTLSVGISRVETKREVLQKPDQLMYRYKGCRGYYPLKDIRREKGIWLK